MGLDRLRLLRTGSGPIAAFLVAPSPTVPSQGFKTLRTIFRVRSGRRFSDPATSRRELEEFVRILPEPGPFRTEPVTVGGIPCEWITSTREPAPRPADRPGRPDQPAPPERALVFFHGGGYVSGSLASHRPLAVRLAAASGARVLQVDYRRAPEHPFPAAFDDARAVLSAILGGSSGLDAGGFSDAIALRPNRIGVVGDSAGGGLAAAALASLANRSDDASLRPAALACLSPWTDLACTGESLELRAAADPLFDRDSLEEMATLYADGADRSDPRLSPLYADLHGLPPTLIQVGDAEVMLSDSTRLAERLEAAGVPVELDVWPEMVHGWQLFAGMVPEGDEAIERIGRFLRERLEPPGAPGAARAAASPASAPDPEPDSGPESAPNDWSTEP